MALKTCGCGRVYADTLAFRRLPFAGVHVDPQPDDPEVLHLELRNCACASTIAVEVRLVSKPASGLRFRDVLWIGKDHLFAAECSLAHSREDGLFFEGCGVEVARRKVGERVSGVELALEFAGGRKGLFDPVDEGMQFQVVEVTWR